MKNAVIVVIILAVLGGGAVLISKNTGNKTPDNSKSTTSQTSSSTQSNSTVISNTDQNSADTITYSDNGFNPKSLTVKAGDTVTIKNTSSGPLQFDSDPHPAHTDDTELNVGTVNPGQSMTFRPTAKGTHGYHNHLNPGDTGTLIVQ
jgi:plastocyanin